MVLCSKNSKIYSVIYTINCNIKSWSISESEESKHPVFTKHATILCIEIWYLTQNYGSHQAHAHYTYLQSEQFFAIMRNFLIYFDEFEILLISEDSF